MKVIRLLFVCLFVCAFAFNAIAQQDGGTTAASPQLSGLGLSSYQVGPGDLLKITVLGEQQMDGEYEVNGDGLLEFPFVETPIPARCRTDREIRADLVTALKKYIRSPQVSLRVTERRSRPPAVIYGAVKSPQQLILNRRVRLLEVLSWAGGTVEGEAAGSLQIFHTTPVMCPAPGEENLIKSETKDDSIAPSDVYTLDIRTGKPSENPYVYPGDIVVIPKAPPVYIVGLVNQPQGIFWNSDLTLIKAVAMVGGPRKEAKTEKVVVRRLKQGSSTEREVIHINLKQIQKGQKDFALQPYDIVEIDEASPWSSGQIGKTLLGLVTGGATSAITSFGQLPTRVIY